MRMAKKNQQKMYYALYGKEVPIYDYYTDGEGNKIPLDTGETKITYETPVEFYGNINESGGEAQATAYGVSVSDYSAVLLPGEPIPIDETSLIWKSTEPTYNEDGTVNEFSADYKIKKPAKTKNVTVYLLNAVVK